MKEVNIYIKDSCDGLYSKEGNYDALLTTQGKELRFSKSFSNTTNYRMMIQGAIDAIKRLKQPCIVNLYTNTAFGMRSIRHKNGCWRTEVKQSVNIDLLLELKDLVEEHGHVLNNFYDKEIIDMMFSKEEMLHDKKSVAVNLPLGVYEKLDLLSQQQGTTINELIKEVLISWSEGCDY